MSDQTDNALPSIADYAIYIVLQVDRPNTNWNEMSVTMGDLIAEDSPEKTNNPWLPPEIITALKTRYATTPVWQGKEDRGVGADFHLHLRKMLSGVEPSQPNEGLLKLWGLTPQARRLVDTADLYLENAPNETRLKRRLVWLPSESAQERLANGGVTETGLVYALKFSGLSLYKFRTGKNFILAPVEIEPIAENQKMPLSRPLLPVEIQEAVVATTRSGDLSWQVLGTPAVKMKKIHFSTVLRRLAAGVAVEERSIDRLFSYTYVRFSGAVAPEAADRFGLFLARHYTSEYALRDDAGAVARVRDFDTVGHIMTLEGATTLVAPEAKTGKLPVFLENYGTVTLRHHYVPLAVLVQHEHAFLVDKTTESNFWANLPRDEHAGPIGIDVVKKLKQLRQDSLQFRLAFRYSQVSLVTMHNAVNRGFRQALSLDLMLAELSADVGEASTFLAQVRDEQLESQFKPWVALGVSIIGGASIFNVAYDFFTDMPVDKVAAGWWSLLIMVASIIVVGAFFAIRAKAHLSSELKRRIPSPVDETDDAIP